MDAFSQSLAKRHCPDREEGFLRVRQILPRDNENVRLLHRRLVNIAQHLKIHPLHRKIFNDYPLRGLMDARSCRRMENKHKEFVRTHNSPRYHHAFSIWIKYRVSRLGTIPWQPLEIEERRVPAEPFNLANYCHEVSHVYRVIRAVTPRASERCH